MSKVAKKAGSLLMVLCMAVSLLTGNINGVETVFADEAYGTLQNGALTDNADGWTISGIENDDVNWTQGYSFKNCLDFYTGNNLEQPIQFSMKQTIENVKGGSYKAGFEGISRDSSCTAITMTVKDLTSGQSRQVTIAPIDWETWSNNVIEQNLEVADGDDVEISFDGELAADSWYQIKNVTFENTQKDIYGNLHNGELTSSIDGWTLSGLDYDEAGEKDQGYSFKDSYLSLYTNESNEGANVSVSQTVTKAEPGSYVVSFAAVGNDGKENMTMTVETSSGAKKEVKIVPAGWDNWNNVLTSEKFEVKDGDNVTITFSGKLIGKEWYGIKNVKLSNTSTTVDADITVEKVDGLSKDFIHGIDVSTYMTQIQSGAKYYDENGNEKEMFQLFKDAGVNYVRLRVWNCPFRIDNEGNYIYVDDEGNEYPANKVTTTQDANGFDVYKLTESGKTVYREGYGAGNCDINTAIAIAKIAQKYDMKILIDFHYSDFWADPGKKTVPKAWKGMSIEDKTAALAKYTTESLQACKDAGVTVSMVQVGNEINSGMAGETGENSYKLLEAGCKAVRDLDPNILIAVHYADPHREGFSVGKAAALASHNIDYDVFATSYYSFWHGTTDNLTSVLKTIATTYNKKVMVAEVSYPFTTEDGDGASNVVYSGTSDLNYSIDAEGQAAAVRDAIAAVNAVGEAGIGTFYWEAAWTPVNNYTGAEEDKKAEVLEKNIKMWENYGSGWASKWVGPEYDNYDTGVDKDMSTHGSQWDNQAFFDFDGHVLPSINVYKYVYTGADGPVRVSSVDAGSVTINYGETPELPQTTTVNLNDGNKVENVSVSWDEEEVAALSKADFGTYTLTGFLGEFSYKSKGSTVKMEAGTYKMTCDVEITGANYVPNGGFEEGKGDWEISGSGNPSVATDKGNAHTGVNYVTVWAESPLDYTVEQTFDRDEIPSGRYMLTAFYQGTNVASVDENASLYVTLTYENGQTRTYETKDIQIPNVWKLFYQSKVKNININDHVSKITVGTHMVCSAGWAVVDDIQLMNCGEQDPKDAAYGQKGSVSDNTSKDNPNPANPTTGPSTPKPSTPSVKIPDKKGTEKAVSEGTFVVTNASATSPEVEFKQAANKTAKKVKIPATITSNGVVYKVTAIADNAFKGNKKLTSVSIPAGVTSIGKNAFSGCTALKSVTIPEGVTSIAANAFKGDKNLKKITIKSTVLKKVGKNAFKGIHAKATIKVPKNQKKAYQKLLKKKGQAATVKIK